MRKLIKKYSNETSIDSKPLFEFKNIFSSRLYDLGFEFDKVMCEEIKLFCKQNGYEIDKVTIVSYVKSDLADPESRLSMSSDHYLKVVKGEDGKLEGVVFLGSSVKVE